jgi:hypothetical protein
MANLTVSKKVRRQILDGLATERVNWAGGLDDIHFLQRLWDVDDLPSSDTRFENMRQDIWQHRINNDDWENDWIYSDPRLALLSGPGETFLQFLCEVVHPAVRKDPDESETLVRFFNECLRQDHVALTTVAMQPTLGRPARRVYAPAALRSGPRPLVVMRFENLLDGVVLDEHLARVGANIDADPALSIGSSKELLESLFKQVIEGCGQVYKSGDDLNELYKRVAELMQLNAESVPANKRGSEAAQRVLRSMVSTVNALAEMRNQLGVGHGRSSRSTALARHAKLAAGVSRAIAEFILETWLVREARRSADQA